MKYISTIVKDNAMAAKKKAVKKLHADPMTRKVITVAVQKVSTTYLKVYAKSNDVAEKIAKAWYETGKYDNNIVKIDGEPAEYLNGPNTYGFTTEILGRPIDDMIDLF